MWQARFYQSLPVIVQEHPKARWLFLTLTVRNMPVCELRDALQHMNKSWQRLINDIREAKRLFVAWANRQALGLD